MILATLLLLLAWSAAVAASCEDQVAFLRCSYLPMEQAAIDATESNFRRSFSAMNFTVDDTNALVSPPISVIWHVIQKGDDYHDGNLPDSQIQGTIDALNNKLGPFGISFTLKKTTRTTNDDWFSNVGDGSHGPDGATASQAAMKAQLREGDMDTLNIYTVSFWSDPDLGGITTFPWEYTARPQNDGIVLRFNTLLGGTCAYFDRGRILTHAVGHWLGLWDVFQEACDGDGDQVDDTPPQHRPTYGCPIIAESCGGNTDSFNNFMDYSWDRCRYEFTDGQITRIKEQILYYRGIKVG